MKPSGFSLVELIVVIIILGILAITVTPRFIDIGTDARIASLKGLSSAIKSTAKMGYAKCLIQSTCNTSAVFNATPNPIAVINGEQVGFHRGYPKAWPHGGTLGIDGLIELSGFTAQPYEAGSFERLFTLDSSPTPETCSVLYKQPISDSGTLEINIDDTGC